MEQHYHEGDRVDVRVQVGHGLVDVEGVITDVRTSMHSVTGEHLVNYRIEVVSAPYEDDVYICTPSQVLRLIKPGNETE